MNLSLLSSWYIVNIFPGLNYGSCMTLVTFYNVSDKYKMTQDIIGSKAMQTDIDFY